LSSVDSAHRNRATNHSFVSSVALIAACSVVTGLAMLGRESETAQVFGRSDEIEAFLVAALIPMFLINATGNSIAAGFVPTLLRVRHDHGQGHASDLIAAFLWVVIALIAAAMTVSALLLPFVLPSIARGFGAGKLALALNLFYWLLPVVAIGALSKFWLAILNGYERFAAGSLIPVVVPLSVIVMLVVAPATARLQFLVLGVFAGFTLQLLGALVIAARSDLLRLPRLPRRMQPILSRATSQYFSMLAGTLTLMLMEVVDTIFAAMQGAGTVAAINYAGKLSLLVLGFVATALATAVVPHYARLRASASFADQMHFVRFGETITVAGGALLALLIASLSTELVTLVFNRGQFGAQDVAVVSKLNALYALQAPAFLAGIVYGRLLLVEGHSRELFVGAVLSVVCAIAANLMLAPLIDSAAIPVAAVIAYVVSAFWLRLRLRAVLRDRRNAVGSDG
jgi:putative peptidoglycan lipid II flippase